MIGYPEDQQSFERARDLAQKGGLDLTLAVIEGWLRRDELVDLVAACHGCAAGYPCDGCDAAEIPAGCANAGRFEHILPPGAHSAPGAHPAPGAQPAPDPVTPRSA